MGAGLAASGMILALRGSGRAAMMRQPTRPPLDESPMKRQKPAIMIAVASVAGVCGLVCAAGPAAAADQVPSMTIIPEYGKAAAKATSSEQLFSTSDSDGNGQIDRAEWQTRKMAIFYIRDRNNDIALSRDEIPGLDSTRFAEADLNGDGALSGLEFNQAAFSQFDKADRNADGVVSRDEFSVYLETLSTPR